MCLTITVDYNRFNVLSGSSRRAGATKQSGSDERPRRKPHDSAVDRLSASHLPQRSPSQPHSTILKSSLTIPFSPTLLTRISAPGMRSSHSYEASVCCTQIRIERNEPRIAFGMIVLANNVAMKCGYLMSHQSLYSEK